MSGHERHNLRQRVLPVRAAPLPAAPNTLEKMRVYGGGPIYRKHGRHVRYHIDDLTAWSDWRKMDSTSDVRTSDAR